MSNTLEQIDKLREQLGREVANHRAVVADYDALLVEKSQEVEVLLDENEALLRRAECAETAAALTEASPSAFEFTVIVAKQSLEIKRLRAALDTEKEANATGWRMVEAKTANPHPQGEPMTYTPKVGDRVNWVGDGSYTVIFVGKHRVMVENENNIESAATITNLTLIPDTVTIELSREDAESVVRDLPEASADFAFGRVALACRAVLEGEK